MHLFFTLGSLFWDLLSAHLLRMHGILVIHYLSYELFKKKKKPERKLPTS